jgi:hypothetical protein
MGTNRLFEINNSKLEEMLSYEIVNVDTALLVPKEDYLIMLKAKAPVSLIWDVADLMGKNVDASMRMRVIRLSMNYKGSVQTPYALLGRKSELLGFIKRYRKYKVKSNNFVHTLTLEYR